MEHCEIAGADLALAILKKWWLVLLAGLICAALVLSAAALFVRTQYQASVLFSVTTDASQLSSGEVSAAQSLTQTGVALVHTDTTVRKILEDSGENLTRSKLPAMLSAESVEDTGLFRVTVTAPTADQAKSLADAVMRVLPGRMAEAVPGAALVVADAPVTPDSPSGPAYASLGLLGALAGMISAAAVIVWGEVACSRKNRKDREESV